MRSFFLVCKWIFKLMTILLLGLSVGCLIQLVACPWIDFPVAAASWLLLSLLSILVTVACQTATEMLEIYIRDANLE